MLIAVMSSFWDLVKRVGKRLAIVSLFLERIEKMSRSFRKNLVVTDYSRHKTHRAKQLANKTYRQRVRRGEFDDAINLSPHIHKRCTESWDIHDYHFRWDARTLDKREKWQRIYLNK